MSKNESLPKWVIEGIQNVKFSKPRSCKSDGYMLELYEKDLKVDVQLYDAVEDGRHIVTMDVPKKLGTSEMERGTVYGFVYEEAKGKIDSKVSEYLSKSKGVEMDAVYQFTLKEFVKVKSD